LPRCAEAPAHAELARDGEPLEAALRVDLAATGDVPVALVVERIPARGADLLDGPPGIDAHLHLRSLGWKVEAAHDRVVAL
jgi:hypothetical protein